jgi:hypothetical protein
MSVSVFSFSIMVNNCGQFMKIIFLNFFIHMMDTLQFTVQKNVHCLVGVYAITITDGVFCWTKYVYCRIMIFYPKGVKDFSLLHSNQACTGAHPAAFSIGPEQSFPKGEAAQGINLTTRSHSAEIKNIPPLSHTASQQPRYNYLYLMFCSFTWQP